MIKNILTILIVLGALLPAASHAAVVKLNASRNYRLTSGLLGYWTFDGSDIPSGVMRDVSGNGNAMNAIGVSTSTFYKPGVIGQSLNFNGTTQYLQTTNTMAFNTKIITVSFWMKKKSYAELNAVGISHGTSDDVDGRFLFVSDPDLTPGESYFDIQDGTGALKRFRRESFPHPSTGVWHHYVAVLDNSTTGGDIIVYIDGQPQSTTIMTNTKDQSTTFVTQSLFVMSRAGTFIEEGGLDDFRIYNRAITAAEVTALYNLGSQSFKVNASTNSRATSGLIGLWSFDGPDLIANVADASGSGNNGFMTNFAATSSVVRVGKIGQALGFDGVDDNVSIGDVNEPSSITLAAWVRPSAVKTGMKIISKKMSGASSQYGLATHGSTASAFTSVFFSSAPSSDVCDSPSGSYSANKWVFVVATYDGDTCKIYVNGADVTTVTSDVASGPILNTASALRIGADGGSSIAAGSYFAGSIDNARIYNKALSATEIWALYNLGR